MFETVPSSTTPSSLIFPPRTTSAAFPVLVGAGLLGRHRAAHDSLVGFISPDVGWFGVTKENGLNIRVAMPLAAIWLLTSSRCRSYSGSRTSHHARSAPAWAFLKPTVSFSVNPRTVAPRPPGGVVPALVGDLSRRPGRRLPFGAVLAGNAFGFAPNEVILFGVATNVVAGIANDQLRLA